MDSFIVKSIILAPTPPNVWAFEGTNCIFERLSEIGVPSADKYVCFI